MGGDSNDKRWKQKQKQGKEGLSQHQILDRSTNNWGAVSLL